VRFTGRWVAPGYGDAFFFLLVVAGVIRLQDYLVWMNCTIQLVRELIVSSVEAHNWLRVFLCNSKLSLHCGQHRGALSITFPVLWWLIWSQFHDFIACQLLLILGIRFHFTCYRANDLIRGLSTKSVLSTLVLMVGTLLPRDGLRTEGIYSLQVILLIRLRNDFLMALR
jgi:hypothetical protein